MFELSQNRIRWLVILATVLSGGVFINFNGWLLLASFVMFQIYWCVGLSAGYHRYFAHRSFTTSKFWEEAMLAVGMVSVFSHPGLHTITHHHHHIYSDTDKDPHKRYDRGLLMIAARGYQSKPLTIKQKRQLLSDPINRRIFTYGLIYPLAWVTTLLLINPWLVVYLWALPVLLVQVCRRVVAVHLVHRYGYRNFTTSDNSRNSKLLGWLFGGEGLHNNHHAKPDRWWFNETKYEVDPTTWFIRCIKHD